MSGTPRRMYWERVHQTRAPDEVSWWQESPRLSLDLVDRAGLPPGARVVDIGAGASTLVDHLLDRGFSVTALDIAPTGLEHARRRLGARADEVDWVEGDVLSFAPETRFDCWHDRAVFHFLVDEADRARYRSALAASIARGGAVVMITFGPAGPETCSGLPVCRYDAESLAAEVGPGYELVARRVDLHRTPSGAEQQFEGALLRRTGGA